MLINKTVDECLIETGGALFQCLVDENLTIEQKKMSIQWLALFLNYQDAVIDKNKNLITFLKEKLATTFTTAYYKKALKEFNNANIIIYNNDINLTIFKTFCSKNISKEIQNIIYRFNETFLNTINNYKHVLTYFDLGKISEDFFLLFLVIHYHLGYYFKQELITIIKTFITIIKKPLYIEQNNSHLKIFLLKKILQENEQFFEEIEPIQLRNFIHSLDDIFSDGLNINNKIEKLILTRPHKIKYSMNKLFIEHGINLEEVLWKKNNESNLIIGNIIMHLFAYETYYVQRNHNYETYENLVLKNVLTDPIYEEIFSEYKKKNKITKIN